jgi:hypothetical protein
MSLPSNSTQLNSFNTLVIGLNKPLNKAELIIKDDFKGDLDIYNV